MQVAGRAAVDEEIGVPEIGHHGPAAADAEATHACRAQFRAKALVAELEFTAGVLDVGPAGGEVHARAAEVALHQPQALMFAEREALGGADILQAGVADAPGLERLVQPADRVDREAHQRQVLDRPAQLDVVDAEVKNEVRRLATARDPQPHEAPAMRIGRVSLGIVAGKMPAVGFLRPAHRGGHARRGHRRAQVAGKVEGERGSAQLDGARGTVRGYLAVKAGEAGHRPPCTDAQPAEVCRAVDGPGGAPRLARRRQIDRRYPAARRERSAGLADRRGSGERRERAEQGKRQFRHLQLEALHGTVLQQPFGLGAPAAQAFLAAGKTDIARPDPPLRGAMAVGSRLLGPIHAQTAGQCRGRRTGAALAGQDQFSEVERAVGVCEHEIGAAEGGMHVAAAGHGQAHHVREQGGQPGEFETPAIDGRGPVQRRAGLTVAVDRAAHLQARPQFGRQLDLQGEFQCRRAPVQIETHVGDAQTTPPLALVLDDDDAVVEPHATDRQVGDRQRRRVRLTAGERFLAKQRDTRRLQQEVHDRAVELHARRRQPATRNRPPDIEAHVSGPRADQRRSTLGAEDTGIAEHEFRAVPAKPCLEAVEAQVQPGGSLDARDDIARQVRRILEPDAQAADQEREQDDHHRDDGGGPLPDAPGDRHCRVQLDEHDVVLVLRIQGLGLQTDGLADHHFELAERRRFLVKQEFDDVLVGKHHQAADLELS